MPWRDSEIARAVIEWVWVIVGPLVMITIGVLYRVYGENDNQCITWKQALKELPGVILLTAIVIGLRGYLGLSEDAVIGLAAFVSWLGPRVIVNLTSDAVKRWAKK